MLELIGAIMGYASGAALIVMWVLVIREVRAYRKWDRERKERYRY